MNSNEYQKLAKFETTYWWHVGRRSLLKNLLEKYLKASKPLILDVGCGTGGNLELLSKFGKVTGIDKAAEAVAFSKGKGFQDVREGMAEKLDSPNNTYDLVTMLDLLEHLESENASLEEARRVLKQDGLLVITVPAYRFLWSGHDVALQHKRRYSRKELESKITASGFGIIKSTFAITTVFLPIAIYRFIQRAIPESGRPKTSYIVLPACLNNAMIELLKIEAWALSHINLPFGVSLVCVAKKKSRDP